MSVLAASHISKQFPGVLALDDVDISIESGSTHCVIGENGAGKSTLIKILTGVYRPDSGTILINGEDAIADRSLFDKVAYVSQELDLFPQLTVAENLLIPFKKTGFPRKLVRKKDLHEFAQPFLNRFFITAKADDLVGDIAVSQQQLLQIARATVDSTAEIILLDEPTTSLTSHEVNTLFEVIKQLESAGKAVVFISHKLQEILDIGTTISVLRNGRKVAESNVEDIDIPWIIREITGTELDPADSFRPESWTDEVILDVIGLSGAAFDDVNFQLKRGEILGFAGLVGAGRTEIMQTIFGSLPNGGGTVAVFGQPWKLGDCTYSIEHGLVYIPEERKRHGIFPQLSVGQNIAMPLLKGLSRFSVISRVREVLAATAVVEDYGIKTASLEIEIQFLSGGNQQKAIIGRAMRLRPTILIFDEPTKGIDVGARAEIYKIMRGLASEGVGIVLVSSDLDEIMRCSNRVITVYNGRLVGEFETKTTEASEVINSIMGVLT